jgi:CubicO group peptidase (beta-lactamase class C family)
MRWNATRRLLLFLALLAAAARPATTDTLADDPRVASALELARGWLEGQSAYERIPGVSAAIVYDQDVLWSGGFGKADLASGRPARADTLYSICSISKLFTSIAVLQQRDAGHLRLDDPVARHLPWFALKRSEGEGDVTIEGLLTHAAGLPRESDYPYWSAPDFVFPTREEIIERLKGQEPLYAPERNFQYSNLGITLAGECAAAAAASRTPTTCAAASSSPSACTARRRRCRRRSAASGWRPATPPWTARAGGQRCPSSRRTASRRRRATPRAWRTWRASPPGSSASWPGAARRC